MGSTDQTDGEWVWPKGLAHYIEHHSVALPEEFIQTMINNRWVCPGVNDLPSAIFDLFDDDFNPTVEWDTSFWTNWGRKTMIFKTLIYRRISHLDQQSIDQ